MCENSVFPYILILQIVAEVVLNPRTAGYRERVLRVSVASPRTTHRQSRAEWQCVPMTWVVPNSAALPGGSVL